MKGIWFLFLSLLPATAIWAQGKDSSPAPYWNRNTQLIPWRLPLPLNPSDFEYVDLDKDGDPDVLQSFIYDTIPILWIDDDDDMNNGDREGDTDNDCLLVDRNRDGIYAGPWDLSIDWNDEDGDGIADIQLIASNGGTENRNYFDWDADFMYIIDSDKDNIYHFVNWNSMQLQAWEHGGHSNFYEDYHGNTMFMKMHASTFRIGDMRYSWENPFIFYDEDNDNLTEMVIRLTDTPDFRPKEGRSESFNNDNKEIDVSYTKRIDWAGIAWDLDNDNGQGNEFDFDMSLNLKGTGFDYSGQVHKYNSLRGLPSADHYLYDPRWRQMDELIYTGRDSAWNMIFHKGNWEECQLVFDEDDDCNRWERVEFYEPDDVFAIGRGKGGLDNNNQADAAGDRGEWDKDFSGRGRLYIGKFDGRLHLYGAEWGSWRIDQTAYSFQGYGGLYGRWGWSRIQREPDKAATERYADTDGNGFIDEVEYDLDGDKVFEDHIRFNELGISDVCSIIPTQEMTYGEFNKLFAELTEQMWNRAMDAVQVAKMTGININWYAFWMQPHSMAEKYDYGYWLNYYLYRDLKQLAIIKKDLPLQLSIDKAFYSGNWRLLQIMTD